MAMTFTAMKLELQKRCLDLGQIKRPDARYGEALNHALSQYPLALCQLNVDGTTLDTVADQREYALSGLSDITTASQVRRVWIDDSDGVKRETGRYEVQDNAGTLTLVLDEAPDDAYDITLEYWKFPAELSGSETTFVDDDWLLTRALIALWSEADWAIDDPQQAVSQLQYLNARLMARERQLLRQRARTSRRPRTMPWRQHV